MKKDLTDVCSYLKGLIIPSTPSGFTVAPPFRHGLTDDELLQGISAFRTFLHNLYDKISADKNRFDMPKAKNYAPEAGEDSIQKCFPIINDIAVVLWTLGMYGKLETEPRKELTVVGSDLLTPLSSTKPPAINKLNSKRKIDAFNFLADMGFYFEDLNLSENLDLSKTGTFYVTYENDDFVILGLKLLAQAKQNVKSGFQKFATTFMRGDFYPLANPVPKAHTATAAEFAAPQPPQIRDWICGAEKLLLDSGCKISTFFLSNTNGEGSFSYASPKSKKTVCRIAMGITGSLIEIRGNHFANEDNILPRLPGSMLNTVKSGRCGGCAEGNPNFVSCRHGGPFKFTYKGRQLERCVFGGYIFSLDSTAERDILKKWLAYEL